MSWLTFFIYINLISFITIFVYRKNNFGIIFLFFFCVLLFFRDESIPDYSAYNDIFNLVNINTHYDINFFKKEYTTGTEYGFVYTIKWFKILFGNKPVIFLGIFSTVVTIINIYSILKIYYFFEHNNFSNHSFRMIDRNPLFLVIYLSYFGLSYSVVAMRVGFSMGLGLLALSCSLEKKYIRAIIILLIAFLFHRMSIIFIILFIIYYMIRKISIVKIKLLWGILGVIQFIGIPNNIRVIINNELNKLLYFFELNYNHYINNAINNNYQISKSLLWSWIILGVYIFTVKYSDKNYKNIIIVLVSQYGMLFLSGIAGAGRITDFFNIFIIFIIMDFYRNSLFSIAVRQLVTFNIILVNTLLILRIWNIF